MTCDKFMLGVVAVLAIASKLVGAESVKDMSPDEKARVMKVVQGDLSVAKNGTERFYALSGAAKNALKKGKKDEARKYAEELEKLAPTFKDDWNYGNAIQNANLVLGRLALAAGDIKEAKRRLLASANSKGSPQMNSFGPNMGLAKELLTKGETDVVLKYFALCGKFWELGDDKLKAWTKAVKKGETPDFGPNLEY